MALRARKYHQLSREFLMENPDGLIVSLGCGFDTRFWRLAMEVVAEKYTRGLLSIWHQGSWRPGELPCWFQGERGMVLL